jgi:hypothetical protein
MGRVARRATMGRLLHVPPNGLERWPKHDPLARVVPGTAPRVVSCLGRAKFHIPRADPFDPARKYMTSPTWWWKVYMLGYAELSVGIYEMLGTEHALIKCWPKIQVNFYSPLVFLCITGRSILRWYICEQWSGRAKKRYLKQLYKYLEDRLEVQGWWLLMQSRRRRARKSRRGCWVLTERRSVCLAIHISCLWNLALILHIPRAGLEVKGVVEMKSFISDFVIRRYFSNRLYSFRPPPALFEVGVGNPS